MKHNGWITNKGKIIECDSTHRSSKIDAVYDQVVKFTKWYNGQG